MAWNLNCLKAKKDVYNKLGCMEKQLLSVLKRMPPVIYKLKEHIWPHFSVFFSVVFSEIWIAGDGVGNEVFRLGFII
jgi:hypothetical protein